MQIAIDTSTDYASIALVHDHNFIAEMTWRCGQNHSVELYPRLDFLLDKAGLDIKSIESVIVAVGPGSFNGLRVGVSAAKGLAFGLGIPIIGVGTLEVMAWPHAESGMPVCALQNAGREEIAAAIYQLKPRKGWTQLSPAHITTIRGLDNELTEKTIICGEIKAETAAQIKKYLKRKIVMSTNAHRLRRAAYLAELGIQRLDAGQADNVSTLQPVYLRRPPITERKKG